MTSFETIHAGYASAVIDTVFFRIDARCFAITGAEAAAVAFRSIYMRTQPSISG